MACYNRIFITGRGVLYRDDSALSVLARQKLCRRLADKTPQRFGQMSLIEITRFMNGIQNGQAALQKGGCLLGTFDLADAAAVQPGRLQKTALHRSDR